MATTDITPVSDETKELLERFQNHLYARCGLSEGTIELVVGYTRRMFAAGIGSHPTQEELDRYVATMRRSKASYTHLVNLLNSLEHYMAFIGDPIHFQRPRRPVNAELTVLSEGKITLLIHAARTLREKALIMVLAYSGCRNNELVNLRVRDVDIPQQALVIQEGKGARGRVCPLAGDCIQILMDYLRERNAAPEDWLFVTVRHRHQLQTQDTRKILRGMAKRAGLKGRVWPHLLRHSLATAILNRGASIFSIQAILGHVFISTTMGTYLHPSARNTRADYHRCAPSFV